MKSIIILGSSGSGKSTALRKAFGHRYGCQTAVKSPLVLNGYQYLPELTGNVKNEIKKEDLIRFLNNGNVTITDVHWNFRTVVMNTLLKGDCEVIVLNASPQEIIRNISSRRETKGGDKDRAIKDSINLNHKLVNSGHKIMTQEEIVNYLTNLTGGSQQTQLF